MATGHALNPRRQDMAIIERRDAVVELRRQRPRPSWRTIGEQLGITAATARTDYLEAMMLTTEHTAELADVEREEQLDDTQKMLDRLLPLVTEPRLTKDGVDLGPSLEAASSVVRIYDLRARLTGAYAPTKIAQTDKDGNDRYASRDYDAAFAALADALAASRATPAADAPGSSGPGGAPAVHVDGVGAPEPIAAEWHPVGHLDVPGGSRDGEDPQWGGMGQEQG